MAKSGHRFDWGKFKAELMEPGYTIPKLEAMLIEFKISRDFIYKGQSREATQKRAQRDIWLKSMKNIVHGVLGRAAVETIEEVEAAIRLFEGAFQTLEEARAAIEMTISPSAACVSILGYSHYCEANMRFALDDTAQRRRGGTRMKLLGLEIPSEVDVSTVTHNQTQLTSGLLRALSFEHNLVDELGYVCLERSCIEGLDLSFGCNIFPQFSKYWELERIITRYQRNAGRLNTFSRGAIPNWAGKNVKEVFELDESNEAEKSFHLKNERFNDMLFSGWMNLAHSINSKRKYRAGMSPSDLAPIAFISQEEEFTYQALGEIYFMGIEEIDAEPGGLSLPEWLRGYSCIEKFSRSFHRDLTGGVSAIPRSDWMKFLQENGLSEEKSRRFTEMVTFKRDSESGSLAERPFIKLGDSDLIVFPMAYSGGFIRYLLSSLSRAGFDEQQDKGTRFEQRVEKMFGQYADRVAKFSINPKGQKQVEVDIIVEWGGRVFILECKNRTFPSYRFDMPIHLFDRENTDIEQVKRHVAAVRAQSSEIRTRTGIDVTNKEIIPCVVYRLPVGARTQFDGIYLVDLEMIELFFKGVYGFEKVAHFLVPDLKNIKESIIVKRFWTGEVPTSDDFLQELEEPTIVKVFLGHLKFRSGDALVVGETAYRSHYWHCSPRDALSSAQVIGTVKDVALQTRRMNALVKRTAKRWSKNSKPRRC